jgi:hypothetical protein
MLARSVTCHGTGRHDVPCCAACSEDNSLERRTVLPGFDPVARVGEREGTCTAVWVAGRCLLFGSLVSESSLGAERRIGVLSCAA